MNDHAKGLAFILLALLGMGYGTKILQDKKNSVHKQVDKVRKEINDLDAMTQQLTRNVNARINSMKQVESFYQSWAPHVDSCQNPAEILSNLLRMANSNSLIPFKKETTTIDQYPVNGETRTVELLNLTLGGDYQNQIRFLEQVRSEYPFAPADRIAFSIEKTNITMSVRLSILMLELPEGDLAMLSNTES